MFHAVCTLGWPQTWAQVGFIPLTAVVKEREVGAKGLRTLNRVPAHAVLTAWAPSTDLWLSVWTGAKSAVLPKARANTLPLKSMILTKIPVGGACARMSAGTKINRTREKIFMIVVVVGKLDRSTQGFGRVGSVSKPSTLPEEHSNRKITRRNSVCSSKNLRSVRGTPVDTDG
ncbi:hypothetical protein FB451DRAFT_1275194 [Mycena latifolia]|nr:hypothetical protein FB451DRAFT_1275194 [Mycena latifolia]